MGVATFSPGDIGGLAVVAVVAVAGVALGVAAVRLGDALRRVSQSVRELDRELVAALVKLGGSVDRVDGELAGLDPALDRAIATIAALAGTVRSATDAAALPVQKAVGLAAGARCAASALKHRHGWHAVLASAREAAARGEQDFARELDRSPRRAG